MNKEEWKTKIYGGASGSLLTIPHIWAVAAPLQLIALFPVLYFASRPTATYRKMVYAGIYMAIFYVLPQAFVLRMPFLISGILFADVMIVFSLFTLFSHWLFLRPSLANAVAVGASLVLLDWLNFTLIPIWGTAQSIVRPWSEYPKLISFISITGLTGIIFLLGALQALIVNIIVCMEQRLRFISAAAVITFAFAATDLILQTRTPERSMKVSAIGQLENSDSVAYPEDANSLYSQLVRQAAQEGSQLVVSPELGFYDQSQNHDVWLSKFQDIARANNVALIIGYAQEPSNKAVFIGADGSIVGDYTKIHLILSEPFEKGDGKLVHVPINGINTGVMICQDDNFTDISRSFGRQNVSMVAVPTMDWLQVKNAHFQNSINRAIESNYAIVRACQNGISAIISPRGEVLKKMNHFKEGSGIITCEVPLYSGRTIFSLLGHWPVVPSSILLLAVLSRGYKNLDMIREE